ncbi:MAG: hypothetical protein IRY99_17400 [Isosphaeraceae bacterium]|nr:hypothetical protein [Isosphaeraceae bacterium]
MSIVGVIAGGAGHPDDGIPVDPDEAPGLTDAVALGEVMEHGSGRLLGHPAVEERGALSFGEAGLAGPTVEQSDVVVLAVAVADGQVAGAALSREGASGILTADKGEVIHGDAASQETGWPEVQEFAKKLLDSLRRLVTFCSTIQGHHLSFSTQQNPIVPEDSP